MSIDPLTGKTVTDPIVTITPVETQGTTAGQDQSASIFGSNYVSSPIINSYSSSVAIPTYSIPSAPIPNYSNSGFYTSPYNQGYGNPNSQMFGANQMYSWPSFNGQSYYDNRGGNYSQYGIYGNSFGSVNQDDLAYYNAYKGELQNEDTVSRKLALPSQRVNVDSAVEELSDDISKSAFSIDAITGRNLDRMEDTIDRLSPQEKDAVKILYKQQTGKSLEKAIKDKKEDSTLRRAVGGAAAGAATGAAIGGIAGLGVLSVPGSIVGGVVGGIVGAIGGAFSSVLGKGREEKIAHSLA